MNNIEILNNDICAYLYWVHNMEYRNGIKLDLHVNNNRIIFHEKSTNIYGNEYNFIKWINKYRSHKFNYLNIDDLLYVMNYVQDYLHNTYKNKCLFCSTNFTKELILGYYVKAYCQEIFLEKYKL